MAGQMVYLEILAGDTGKAREFWGSLFGWEWQAFEGPTEYHMTRFSDTSGGAIMQAEGSERGTRVYFDVDENSYLRYGEQEREGESEQTGTTVRVGLANEQGYPHLGTISFFDNQVDSAVGTIRVRAVLPNPTRIFTPGLFVRVQLVSGRKEYALLIDDRAVMTDQDRKYVYVLGKDNKVQRKYIVPGRMAEGLRVIQSGLAPEDKVVVAGQQKIRFPGMLVKPYEISMATP